MNYNNINFIKILLITIKYTSFLYLLSYIFYLWPYTIRNQYVKSNIDGDNFKYMFIFCRIISLIVLILAIYMSFDIWKEYRTVKNIIDRREYQVIEGTIDDYLMISNNKVNCELFNINNISFSTNSYFSGLPKEMNLYHGEHIGDIGQKIKVYYVYNYRGNRQNTILYIERNE